MGKKSKNSIDDISSISFNWSDDMSASSGFTAQEVNDVLLDTITINGGTDYSITGAQGASVHTITLDSSVNWNNGYTTYGSGVGGTEYGKSEIKLANGKSIDLDELADIIETMKKRLLILAPNFEMHEKYPMLKELYDEYKAMEKLLSGPDSEIGEL